MKNIIEKIVKDVAKYLFEGLITTYPIDKTIKHMVKKFGFTQIKREFENNIGYIFGYIEKTKLDNNEDVILLSMPNRKNDIDNVKHEFDVYGYFLSRSTILNGNSHISMLFAKKHQNDANKIVRKYRYLYHVTNVRNKNKILEKGLIPKSKNKKSFHPDRIYFALKHETSKKIVSQLSKFYEDDRALILKIDINKIPDNVSFYFDPDAKGYVYTKDNITPNAITINKN